MAFDENNFRAALFNVMYEQIDEGYDAVQNEAQWITEEIQRRHPEWLEKPRIAPITFLKERVADLRSRPPVLTADRMLADTTEKLVLKYIHAATDPFIPGQRALAMIPVLRILADNWTGHPDYERIDWP